jgi:hypothetical protein
MGKKRLSILIEIAQVDKHGFLVGGQQLEQVLLRGLQVGLGLLARLAQRRELLTDLVGRRLRVIQDGLKIGPELG